MRSSAGLDLEKLDRKFLRSLGLMTEPARSRVANARDVLQTVPPRALAIVAKHLSDNFPTLGLRQIFVGINAVKSLQQDSNLVFHCLFPFAAPIGAHR